MRCERCGARVHSDVRAGSCPRDCHPTVAAPGFWGDVAFAGVTGAIGIAFVIACYVLGVSVQY